jgi:hypothetical protein
MLTEDQLYIDKTRTLPPGQDFSFLRAEGLKYIEELASAFWTDYNSHDPGVTILEALCYAITELGYRTDFDTKDLMAAPDGSIDGNQAFFSAKNILTAEPLTVEDYRKLLVDIVGIKNAWLYPYRDADFNMIGEPDQEVLLYANCKKDILTYTPTEHPVKLHGLYQVVLNLEETDEFGDLNTGNLIYQFAVEELLDIKFQLLFPHWNETDYEFILNADTTTIANILVAFANDRWAVSFDVSDSSETRTLTFDALILLRKEISSLEAPTTNQLNDPVQVTEIFSLYQKKIEKVIGILTQAKSTLHAHRNLSEDFLPPETICTQEVAFCADIEVSADTDIEEVYATVLFELENYLNPEIKFYTLKELVDEGIPSEQIFEGPILQHGFLKTDELKATQLRSRIIVSDIINFIMDIEGVLAVKNVLLTKYSEEGKAVLPSERWCLNIEGGCKPVLNIFRSKVLFFKGRLPFRARMDETLDTLKFLRGRESRNKLKGTADDFKIPKGTYRHPEDFASVQYEFPMTYAIGKFGLPNSATSERKAQAKQLKAYLQFYDQILANFFSQLAHASDLFSLDAAVTQTYFGQYLNEVRDLENIYVNPTELERILSTPDPTDSDAVKKGRELLFEDQDLFYDRRNRFLDHLIARFAESFNEYVLMLYAYRNADEYDEIDTQELINDKIAFLKDYPVISRERGKAFDYLQPAWDTDNVSGLEKRLARLAGIDDFTRRFLFCLKTIEIQRTEDTPPKYFFEIKDETGSVLLKSSKEYDTYPEIDKVSLKLSEVLADASAYQPRDIAADQFSFEVVDESSNPLAVSGTIYPDQTTRDDAIETTSAMMAEDCPDEGLHLVEHILLRPRFAPPAVPGEEPEDTYQLFTVCLGENCQFCGEEDPYSFRLTLVLPYWHTRFQSMEFRGYFETLARTEAPAHCMIKVCWVNNTLMNSFERAYKAWMEALADYEADLTPKESKQEALRLASNQLIALLTDIHSEYPEARLHDCDEGTTNPVLLNNTILGTNKI